MKVLTLFLFLSLGSSLTSYAQCSFFRTYISKELGTPNKIDKKKKVKLSSIQRSNSFLNGCPTHISVDQGVSYSLNLSVGNNCKYNRMTHYYYHQSDSLLVHDSGEDWSNLGDVSFIDLTIICKKKSLSL